MIGIGSNKQKKIIIIRRLKRNTQKFYTSIFIDGAYGLSIGARHSGNILKSIFDILP